MLEGHLLEGHLLQAIGLTRRFGSFVAVDDVSFSVARGEVVGFLGPNGAGKTTSFRMLTGCLGPTSGTVRIAGFDLASRPTDAKRQLGYLPEGSPLPPELTVREYLLFRARLRGSGRGAPSAVRSAAERTRIDRELDVRIGHLSRGYRQRVGLAEVLLESPPVLLLDEPTAGLDPNQVLEVRELIRELGQDHAVLLSTHVLSEVTATCQRAVVISAGKVAARAEIGSDTSELEALFQRATGHSSAVPRSTPRRTMDERESRT